MNATQIQTFQTSTVQLTDRTDGSLDMGLLNISERCYKSAS